MSEASVVSSAKQEPKVGMHLKVYRKATNTWEDGPEAHTVDVGLGRFFKLKLKVLSRLLNKFNNWLKKLEEMR
jgi:ABC-type phosphate/phosphonate transport system permease subunit